MSQNSRPTQKDQHLLDILAERFGCDFLSDLRLPANKALALRELHEGCFADFDAKQVKEAEDYLNLNWSNRFSECGYCGAQN